MKTESSLRAPGQMTHANKTVVITHFNIQNESATHAQQARNSRVIVLEVLHCMFLPMPFNGQTIVTARNPQCLLGIWAYLK